MATGILGSGFGIYGYLPSLARTEDVVFILERARSKIECRAELVDFRNQIQYVDSLSSLLGQVDKLVIALPPKIQGQILTENNLVGKKLFLEKPLGENIEEHLNLLNLLGQRKLSFKVAYLFLYTEWVDRIARSAGKKYKIHWIIPRSDSAWKLNLISEFGVESYYGMHFYPIYKYLGIPSTDLRICDTAETMRITDRESRIEVNIQVGHSHKFEVCALEDGEWSKIYSAKSPFGEIPKSGFTDPRVEFLSRYLSNADKIISEATSYEIEEYVLQCRAIKRNSGTS